MLLLISKLYDPSIENQAIEEKDTNAEGDFMRFEKNPCLYSKGRLVSKPFKLELGEILKILEVPDLGLFTGGKLFEKPSSLVSTRLDISMLVTEDLFLCSASTSFH